MSEYDELLGKVRTLPPMTDAERAIQRLDFAYGNLACSSRHRPSREVFKFLAEELNISGADFDRWADTKEWWAR